MGEDRSIAVTLLFINPWCFHPQWDRPFRSGGYLKTGETELHLAHG